MFTLLGTVAGIAATAASPARPGVAAPSVTSGGLELTVLGADQHFAVRLINRGTQACQVATTAVGTVALTRVDQGGAATTPEVFYPTSDDDLSVGMRHSLKTLRPGDSVDIPLRTLSPDSSTVYLESIAWSPLLAMGFLYPLQPDQPVYIEANYALPINVEGAPTCPPAMGASAPLPGTPGMARWLIWGLVAAGVVGLLLVIVLILRGRSRRTRAAVSATVVLGVALAATVSGAPPRAYATIDADSNTQAAWNTCLSLFHQPGFDPAGIIEKLRSSSVRIHIDYSNVQTVTSFSTSTPDIFIHWYYDNPEEYGPGVPRTPCDTLYHELYHAWENTYGKGGIDRHECITVGGGRSGISIKEVNATRAQNELRKKMGLPPRTFYGNHRLPDGTCLPSSWGNPYLCHGEPEICGDSNGDPHLWTFDGARFDFQAVGEFVATRDPAGGFEVHVRQQPWAGSRIVSVNTAVAADVNGDRVEIDVVDGHLALTVAGTSHPLASVDLPGGGSITHDVDVRGDIFTLTWPDQSQAVVVPFGSWGLHLIVHPAGAHAGKLEGLFGDFDGDQTNDIRPRGGTPITEPSFDTLYPSYADSWRVDSASSLFHYAAGTDTATYTDRTFPDRPAVAKDLPGHEWAERVCRDNDLTDPITIDSCVVDLLLTGRPDFVVAARDTQAAVGGPQVGGAASTLTIGSPGAVGRIHFSGTQGQKILVDVSSTLPDACGVVTLRAPDDTTIGSTCIVSGKGRIDATVLPTTGTYTIVVDPPGDATGEVEVRLISASDVQGALTVGGPEVSTRIDQGGVARLTFPGTAGQKIFADYTSTLPTSCGVVTLLDPKGDALASGCVVDGDGFLDGTVLPATGTYTVLVDPAGTDTGEIRLRLISVTDQLAAIGIGGAPVTATIGQPGGVSRLTFSATAGQKVAVEVTNSTVPNACGVVSVRKPNGDEVAAGCIVDGTGFVDGTVLPDTGQYTLVVDPGARDVGQSSVRLFAITDVQSVIAVDGADVTVTIAQPGGVGRLTFPGTAGQNVVIDIVSSTLPNQCGVVYLRDPTGSEVAGGCIVDGKGGIPSKTLPVTGQYTIVIDPGWPATGTAIVRLHT